ncbi:MAG: PaaI family thioesterase [Eggerthellaceae bacterium]|nr:PaaI family thioesterase [Eggerthellaceae bacterium]
MLSENPAIEDVRELFAGDRFATEAAGCRVMEGRKGYAVCEMDITDVHRNAFGGVMGGAIFTLADYALAVSCNLGEEPTVAAVNTIEFMSAAKGTKLIATSSVDKSGRHLGFYTVEVTDDTGRKVAKMTATCYR